MDPVDGSKRPRKKGSGVSKPKSHFHNGFIIGDGRGEKHSSEIGEKHADKHLSVVNGSGAPENHSSTQKLHAPGQHASHAFHASHTSLAPENTVYGRSSGKYTAGSPNSRTQGSRNSNTLLHPQPRLNASQRKKIAAKTPSTFFNFSRYETQRVSDVARPADLLPVRLAAVESEKNEGFRCTRHWICIGGLVFLMFVVVVTYGLVANFS